ncbi:MAG: hypothetical protein WCP86_08875 [bacterium]
MEYVNAMANAVFRALISPFRGMNHWYGMLAISFASAVVLLAIFKATSNRQSIRRSKNRAIARLLELLLFKDDIVVNLGALGRTVAANVVYMGSVLRPMLFSIVPFALILIQLSVWFGHSPLQAGETTLLKATLSEPASNMAQLQVTADPSPGIEMETPSVRIPSRNEIAWRLKATAAGPQYVDVLVNGVRERKNLAVGTAPCPVSPVRGGTGLWDELLHPTEAPLPNAGALTRIEVDYPESVFALGNHNIHWLLIFIILTMAIAWALKKPFRVEI